jgi:hypothetical protein
VRSDKGFRIFDLIIYGAVAVLIVALFLAFVVFRDRSQIDGVSAYINNELVFTYTFEDDEYKIVKEDNVQIISDDDKELKVKFVIGDGYNDMTINKYERSANVTDADCSARKDCVYMDSITEKSKSIHCTPHGLKILPAGYEAVDDGYLNM